MTTTTKTIAFALLVAIFIALADCAALTPGNLLAVRISTAKIGDFISQVYIDELALNGTVVQTFTPPDCMIHDLTVLGLSFNQDFTTAATNCFISSQEVEFFDLWLYSRVVAINADGTMDNTTIPLTGTSTTGSLVDGRNVWVGSGSVPLIYSRRNGAMQEGTVIETPAAGLSFATDIQCMNNVFYIGGHSASPYFIATVDGGAPTSASNASTVTPLITADTIPDLFTDNVPQRFYAWSNTEFYGTSQNSGLFKIYNTSGAWQSYSVSPNIGPTLGIVVAEVGGKRMVYVSKDSVIMAFEDDGTKFIGPTTIKSYDSFSIGDVTYIGTPANCQDGAKNKDETDVDCGGDVCSGCAEGKSCVVNGDCESDNCVDNTCAAANTPEQRTTQSGSARLSTSCLLFAIFLFTKML